MEYLLDMHIFLWYVEGSSKLSPRVLKIIQDKSNGKLVSIASLWEIAIKINKGNLNLSMPFPVLDRYIELNQFKILPVSFEHLIQIEKIPRFHADPFDHLLIAQAMIENLTIVSADRHFTAYPINVIA